MLWVPKTTLRVSRVGPKECNWKERTTMYYAKEEISAHAHTLGMFTTNAVPLNNICIQSNLVSMNRIWVHPKQTQNPRIQYQGLHITCVFVVYQSVTFDCFNVFRKSSDILRKLVKVSLSLLAASETCHQLSVPHW